MANIILIVPILFSFLVTFIMMPYWIKRTKKVGLVGKDMNKRTEKRISEAGGICVFAGFILGVLIYIAIKTFVLKTEINIIETFALISTILIISFIGLLDDIFGWKIGLSKRARLLGIAFGAIPLIVINAGSSFIELPFIGSTNLGLIYPLILIPLGIVGASTTFNFLAGFNGLEASMGFLVIGELSLIAWLTGNSWLSLIGLCMIAALSAFYIFNKYPSKVFPGDVLTYSVGALIAIMAILGNFEKIAIFIFTPYFLEIFLKARGNFKKESFAIPQKNKTLEMPYKKMYSLTHVSLFILKKFKKKVYEKDIVYLIFGFQLIINLLALIIFREVLF